MTSHTTEHTFFSLEMHDVIISFNENQIFQLYFFRRIYKEHTLRRTNVLLVLDPQYK